MAYNVFGKPITNQTLEAMPEYKGKTIRRTDRAHVALNMKNADAKADNARKYAENLKSQFDRDISTQCLIYNATGDRITVVLAHDFQGTLGAAPYPIFIENGQWGAFLHVSWLYTGSIAATVYRGKNEAGDECDWMLAWCNPYNKTSYHNAVLTDIHPKGYYSSSTNWSQISDDLHRSPSYGHKESNGCKSDVTIGSLAAAVFEATLTLSNA